MAVLNPIVKILMKVFVLVLYDVCEWRVYVCFDMNRSVVNVDLSCCFDHGGTRSLATVCSIESKSQRLNPSNPSNPSSRPSS